MPGGNGHKRLVDWKSPASLLDLTILRDVKREAAAPFFSSDLHHEALRQGNLVCGVVRSHPRLRRTPGARRQTGLNLVICDETAHLTTPMKRTAGGTSIEKGGSLRRLAFRFFDAELSGGNSGSVSGTQNGILNGQGNGIGIGDFTLDSLVMNVISVNPADENATVGTTAMMNGGMGISSNTGSNGSAGNPLAFTAAQGFASGEAYFEGGYDTSYAVEYVGGDEDPDEVIGEAISSQFSESGASGVSTSSCNTDNEGDPSDCGSSSDIELTAENVVETSASSGKYGTTAQGVAGSAFYAKFASVGSFNATGTFGSGSGYAAGEGRIGSGNFGKGTSQWERLRADTQAATP